MSAFIQGQQLKENDLKLNITDPMNPAQKIDAFSIVYSIHQLVSAADDTFILLPPADRIPGRFDVGHYFVDERIQPLATIGTYEVRWTVRRTSTSITEVIARRFSVVGLEKITDLALTEVERFLVHRTRILLRDNNPDRYYKFQPPTPDAELAGFTERFGFIWQDEELIAHLETGLSDINLRPPETNWNLDSAPSAILALLLVSTARYALSSLETMWIGEDFSYSINGVSLDLDKAAKYAAQRDYYENTFQQMVERYKASLHFIRGLRQPRYAVGIASRLGPFSRSGVLSLRNFSSSTRAQY